MIQVKEFNNWRNLRNLIISDVINIKMNLIVATAS